MNPIVRKALRATMAKHVAQGAALLDKQAPGWADEISLIDLDMSDPEVCVVGQLYETGAIGDPWGSAYRQGLHLLNIDPNLDAAVYFGFEDIFGDYAELTELWTREIQARRSTPRRDDHA